MSPSQLLGLIPPQKQASSGTYTRSPGLDLGRTWLAVAALLLLVACGGGGEDEYDAPRRGVQPVDCKIQPTECA
jgi:hypothetical protein